MTRKRLVVGNWKMYIDSLEGAEALAVQIRRNVRGIAGVEVWLAPPFPYLSRVSELLESSPVRIGAQTLSPGASGQYTGGVSAKMLKNIGASFALIGHSERRTAGDTNEQVALQVERAIETGLTPVLCIGEREREKDGEHFEFLEKELTSALKIHIPKRLSKLVIAYEPVWAIGKNAKDAMKPAELQEMTIFIRKILTSMLGRQKAHRIPILYGGSVDETNAEELMQEGGVSGFLVGRASTDAASFLEIVRAARTSKK